MTYPEIFIAALSLPDAERASWVCALSLEAVPVSLSYVCPDLQCGNE